MVYGGWMRSLGAAAFFICCSATALWGADTPGDSEQGAQSAGAMLTDKIAPYVGSRDAVQRNLIAPMVSGGLLTSMDGSTSFRPGALTTSDDPLLRVSVFPNPATGDVLKILVEQDLSGSGSFTTASVYPVPAEASGQMIASVCANGYIQCDTGTYSNCRYREWDSDSSGLILSIPAGGSVATIGPVGSIAALSACYCFNRACSRNNSAVLNIDNITANVGGGVLSAFLAANTGMMVTGAQSTGTGQITYHGVAASSVPDGTKAMTPEQVAIMPVMSNSNMNEVQSYYNNSGALAGMGETARQQQIGSPNSMFNLVKGVAERQAGSTVNCTNLTTPTLNLKTLSTNLAGDGAGSVCADDRVWAVLTQTDTQKFSVGVVGTGPGGLTSIGHNCPNYFFYNEELKYISKFVDRFELVQPSNVYGYEIRSITVNMSLSGEGCNNGTVSVRWTPAVGLNNPIVVQSSMVCPNNGAQSPTFTWSWIVEYQAQELSNVVNLGCSQLESDTNCTVKQETWDGRPVIVNGLSTGFQLGRVCKDLVGPLRNTRICTPPERMWFKQDKTFYCRRPNPPYDFGPAMLRAKEVQSSATMTSNTAGTYSDGGIVNSIQLPRRGPDGACPQVCKTRTPANEFVMTYTGNPSSSLLTESGVTDQSWSFFFKECDANASGTWTCPVDAAKGEEVVTQCGCSSDIGAVIAGLTAANEAAQDSICSKE